MLAYVEKSTVLDDLIRSHVVVTDDNGNLKGKIEGQEYRKCLIRWIVYGTGKYDEAWRDVSLFKSWIDYFSDEMNRDETAEKGLCGISFEKDMVLAESHPKGVQPLAYGAKLISSNDSSGFTYRGRLRNITFAAVKKYRNDTFKEEWNLALDKNCTDRSYLLRPSFGHSGQA